MKKTAIIYGSSTGNTEGIAKQLQTALDADIFDVSQVSPDTLGNYPYLVFGTSTWGSGDLQDDWDSFLPKLSKINFAGKKVAIFGLGDSGSYSDTFCDGIGVIYNAIPDKSVIVGQVPPTGYSFDSTQALVDGVLVGLPLDEENESNQTSKRLAAWVEELKKQFV